eukprot:1153832-Pelagomonas_calceolata.AAC.4
MTPSIRGLAEGVDPGSYRQLGNPNKFRAPKFNFLDLLGTLPPRRFNIFNKMWAVFGHRYGKEQLSEERLAFRTGRLLFIPNPTINAMPQLAVTFFSTRPAELQLVDLEFLMVRKCRDAGKGGKHYGRHLHAPLQLELTTLLGAPSGSDGISQTLLGWHV